MRSFKAKKNKKKNKKKANGHFSAAKVKLDFRDLKEEKGDGNFSAARVNRKRKLPFHETFNLLFYYSNSRKANGHYSSASISR